MGVKFVGGHISSEAVKAIISERDFNERLAHDDADVPFEPAGYYDAIIDEPEWHHMPNHFFRPQFARFRERFNSRQLNPRDYPASWARIPTKEERNRNALMLLMTPLLWTMTMVMCIEIARAVFLLYF
jgi:hypothetical protein